MQSAILPTLNEDTLKPEGTHKLLLRFNNMPAIQLLNGNRFIVSSPDGDVSVMDHGLYRDDTRFLSTLATRINGKPLISLNSNYSTPYSAEFYLTNPELQSSDGGTVSKESLMIGRHRMIDRSVQEDFYVFNVSLKPAKISLSFEVDADFLDLFEVKEKAFADKPDMGKPEEKPPEPPRQVNREFLQKENGFNFTWTDPVTGFAAQAFVYFSEKGRVEGNKITFDLNLEPSLGGFHVLIGFAPFLGKEIREPGETSREQIREYAQDYRAKVAESVVKWRLTVPKMHTSWDELRHSYYQSLMGLVSLQITDPSGQGKWTLPAAGTPWFMTLFGRDTLITAYQIMLFGPNLAKGAIESLAYYQATGTDTNRDMEPGKIIHEIRYGPYAARTKRFPYYGTIDATPLFVILASEIFRWTNDVDFVTKFKPNVLNAIKWIDDSGDMDKDGFVEYIKKSPTGLVSQSWKDSWNSMQFMDGRVAEAPIATCEVQGYVYDAKLRVAEIAKEVWKDNSLAKKLVDEANDLKQLFNEKYWIEDKGYYALALDKNKDQVDSMSSNNGHLLWSGIVQDDRVDSVVENLLNDDMWSGYGIRTLSRKSKGYSPIGYHNGTIWPHDNSYIAMGLARYGKKKEALQVVEGMLDAIVNYGFLFPEVFGGARKDLTAFPVNYPTSCYPQAWAAGATLLFLRTLLGVSPSRSKQTLELNPILGPGSESITLEGVEAFGQRFTVSAGAGRTPMVGVQEEAATPSIL
jgi:glycogen debranching enzyme